jgi:hypothetical protein
MKTSRWVALFCGSCALLACGAFGRDIHVGTDTKTIAGAIKKAQPGDTIHLQPIVYHDYAGFYAKQGEPGKPITLDGHGATLEVEQRNRSGGLSSGIYEVNT